MAEYKIIQGDCLSVLKSMDEESVHCCVTSPPYFGLRDYGIDGQFGLEQTPEEYVANMVAVFREVRRVLRRDGTLWLNIGDSYAGSWGNYAPGGIKGTQRPQTENGKRWERPAYADTKLLPPTANVPGLKPKDLIGIPWMVAKALQAPYYVGRIKREADRAYLAGFIDGEGTISFVERDRGPNHTPTYDVRIFATNCDDATLREFCDMTAGHVYQHEQGKRKNRFGYLPCYRWQMGTHDGALLIRELYPYLRSKRKQAILMWTLYLTLRHKNGHARTPTDVVEKRQAIAEMVHTLNAGGDVDLPGWVEEPPAATEPGWWLRSDIVWSKSNPMPESVTDRPTKAHEYLFLLAKAERYYYDAGAVAERSESPERPRLRPNGLSRPDEKQNPIGHDSGCGVGPTRNRRTVWTVATTPYRGAHFATFPPKLIEPCILAGTSAHGVCAKCGAPWRRVVERIGANAANEEGIRAMEAKGVPRQKANLYVTHERGTTHTLGWQSSCSCDAPVVPAIVIDPFCGSGTTGEVALNHRRNFIGIELNPDYIELAHKRIKQNTAQLTLF